MRLMLRLSIGLTIVSSMIAVCALGSMICQAQGTVADNPATVSASASDQAGPSETQIAKDTEHAITQQTTVSVQVLIALCGLTATVIGGVLIQRSAFAALSQSVKEHHSGPNLHLSMEDAHRGMVSDRECGLRHGSIDKDLTRIEGTVDRIEAKVNGA